MGATGAMGAMGASGGARASMVQVRLPVLEGSAKMGERAFGAKCAACHAKDGGGVEGSGPPLIHKIYEPSHHGDMAFVMAAERGVQSHHWGFGNMPPVEGITRAEIVSIIAYVRAVQKENGIF